MIIYSSTKKEFVRDVMTGFIEQKVVDSFVREAGARVSDPERRAFQNSLPYMSMVINDLEIPDNAGVAIEFKIPQTSKRIDFILSGYNEKGVNSIIVVELKQWRDAEITDMDGVVKTFLGGKKRETNHPSYQAWSYTSLLEDYNSGVQDNKIELKPCAYLHNYIPDDVIKNNFYQKYLDAAPVFWKSEALALQNFIKRHIKSGDNSDGIYLIENGKIKPSKALSDSLCSMLKGNDEFILIDDQKIIFEAALLQAKISNKKHKRSVMIVEGGPGTGKSVVAINLLVAINKLGLAAQYVTRNSAPRQVYQEKLKGKIKGRDISNAFKSSGAYYDSNTSEPSFGALIVDEAHRLNEKSGMYNNKGTNQIMEIIQSTMFSIFFVDEDQRVSIKDIGTRDNIKYWANNIGAEIFEYSLQSQFRCNGSDGYIPWLDNVLQIKNTANDRLDDLNYDFRVFNDPQSLHEEIIFKNSFNDKSRLVAGYCWKWVSKKDDNLNDIVIKDYAVKWNLDKHGQTWIIQPGSVSEVGCIHTCQGLELEYVGVIIGPDLIVRNGKVVTDFTKRAISDQSLKGIKTIYKNDPSKAEKIADSIIKNTYRTLMTRGMKGCYIYSVDKETNDYFRECQTGVLNIDSYF